MIRRRPATPAVGRIIFELGGEGFSSPTELRILARGSSFAKATGGQVAQWNGAYPGNSAFRISQPQRGCVRPGINPRRISGAPSGRQSQIHIPHQSRNRTGSESRRRAFRKTRVITLPTEFKTALATERTAGLQPAPVHRLSAPGRAEDSRSISYTL